ncbi:MAG: hypothetical protein ACI9EQ_000627 [Bacteroidia bacterium]
MEESKLVDLVLDELASTRQASVSVRRVFKKREIDYTNELITSIESILKSRSLVAELGKDSKGYLLFSLSVTGHDFLKSYGSYSKYLRGIESESKKVARAKKKKPFQTHNSSDGKPPLPFIPKEASFLRKNRTGLLILLVVLILFYIVSKITESVI